LKDTVETEACTGPLSCFFLSRRRRARFQSENSRDFDSRPRFSLIIPTTNRRHPPSLLRPTEEFQLLIRRPLLQRSIFKRLFLVLVSHLLLSLSTRDTQHLTSQKSTDTESWRSVRIGYRRRESNGDVTTPSASTQNPYAMVQASSISSSGSVAYQARRRLYGREDCSR